MNKKIKYIGCSDAQVRWGSHDDPRKVLKENEVYTINKTVVHDTYTELYLEEFPDLEFNSVCFEEEK